MFKKTVVASVGLPKGVWEPLRLLNDIHMVKTHTLAKSWGMSEREMLKVIYAARLSHMSKPQDSGLDILDEDS